MTEHLVIRTNLTVASIRLAQAIVPAVVSVATLAILTPLLRVNFDEFYAGLAAVTAILTTIILRPPKLGSQGLQMTRTDIGVDVILWWALILTILLALGFVTGITDYFARRVILPWAAITPVLIVVSSVLLQRLMRSVILSQRNQRSAVIAGVNQAGVQLARKLTEFPELCMRPAGFFDDRSADRLGDNEGAPVLGKLADLADYVNAHQIDIIFIALPIRHVQRVMALLDELRDTTASIYYVPDIFMFDLIQSRTMDIYGMPAVAMCETPFYGYRGVLKRVSDISLTLGALLIALPVMLGLAIAIKLDSSGPALFRQKRYGIDGHEIIVYKFRSMRVTEDGPHITQAKRDDPRITRVGRFIRKYSLDELPQLLNVLEGRMSLVGPRPHAVAHNEEYRHLIKGYMIRHKVLPGITGLAQVNGCRGETSNIEEMQRRIDFDLNYLRHWTPMMDIKILLRTVVLIFRDPKAY